MMNNSKAQNTQRYLAFHLPVIVLMWLGWVVSSSAQDVVLDRIRAVVNEGVVLESDVNSAIRFYKQQARSNRQSLPDDSIIAERILDELINREIRQQHAETIGVAVDPNTVNRTIEQLAANNNMDTFQFRRALQQEGFDYDLFRENVRQDLLMQRLIDREVQSRIRISAQEIDDYIDAINNDAAERQKYRLQHILVAVSPAASQEELNLAEEKAQLILDELARGSDFGEVAATYSDGSRALQGGDLGWRTRQELPDFLSAALKSMQVGDISEPLKSPNGLHIIILNDTDSEDRTRVSETLARHIFIAGNDSSVPQRLEAARQALFNGRPFADLAAEISEDPNSANNGGELPWFSKGQLPEAMEATANRLAINTVSEPFRTQFGWHIIQVLDRRERPIDEQALRDQANAALRQGKIEQETERWLRQLRDESFVEIRS